ncbi:MAG: tRNA pseudouridine(13) synthase TruD [Woeseiaceae bacterium]
MALPEWARAHGPPLCAATLRSVPDDFQVTEILDWPFSGDGEHDYLWIEKTGANTEWVARQLARHAGVQARDVGYAGLKDRHAVTRQWFSVPRWNTPDWTALFAEGVAVLDVQRHQKKLRRGAHRGNRFRIVLRGDGFAAAADALGSRLELIREQGVPNYFGEQRFGRGGANLKLTDDWAAGRRLPRHKRSLAISTVRSFLFNEQLDARVQDGTWNRLLPDDVANLDGTGSVFDVAEVDEELVRRCAELDIHPTGVLAGEGSGLGSAAWRNALDNARVEPGARSLRLRVDDLCHEAVDAGMVVTFFLRRGAYATSVLREIATCHTSGHDTDRP